MTIDEIEALCPGASVEWDVQDMGSIVHQPWTSIHQTFGAPTFSIAKNIPTYGRLIKDGYAELAFFTPGTCQWWRWWSRGADRTTYNTIMAAAARIPAVAFWRDTTRSSLTNYVRPWPAPTDRP